MDKDNSTCHKQLSRRIWKDIISIVWLTLMLSCNKTEAHGSGIPDSSIHFGECGYFSSSYSLMRVYYSITGPQGQ